MFLKLLASHEGGAKSCRSMVQRPFPNSLVPAQHITQFRPWGIIDLIYWPGCAHWVRSAKKIPKNEAKNSKIEHLRSILEFLVKSDFFQKWNFFMRMGPVCHTLIITKHS